MITNHESGNNRIPVGAEILSHKYVYVGKVRYLQVWYQQNGVKRMERFLSNPPAPRKEASKRTKDIGLGVPKKAMPENILKKMSEAKKIAKPSFTQSKPAKIGAFSFSEEKPNQKQVVVPQPPPLPGPKPQMNLKSGVSVTKYEYLYGIKNLEIKHAQYDSKSVYVSKPIKAEGNVVQVSLHSIEEHPFFDELSGKAADRQTSIEYYIASVGTNPNPTLDDWHPILPEHVRSVKSELLMFGTARTAELRFHALIGSKEKPVVYKNGLAINEDDWSFVDGGAGMQLLAKKDPTAIYTIDYTPNAEFYNPWVIDVNQQGSNAVKHTDVFENGTNHNKTVVLTKYPFVNYEKINQEPTYDPNLSSYVPIKVRLLDAGIVGPSRTRHKEVLPYNNMNQFVYTKNITDYKTGYHEPLRAYSIDRDKAYNGFEYYQEGNKLFFSETFNHADVHTNEQESHGNAKIAVEYEYLSSDFRMKIILRRNSADVNTLTPIVHEYTLKFKVMK